MRGVLLFAVIVTPLAVAVAKPSDSSLAALSNRQLTSDLRARSGINPTSISKECQSQCTTIIQTLDNCSSASCECTQSNYDALGVCMNCLTALGPQYLGIAPGETYLDEFIGGCATFGIVLNAVAVTATPTGISSTGDPLSLFEPQTPTSGATAAVTASLPPLVPIQGVTPSSGSSVKNGSPVELNAIKALGAGAVVAAIASVAVLSASFL